MLTLKCDAINCCVLLFADWKSVQVAFAASSQCNRVISCCMTVDRHFEPHLVGEKILVLRLTGPLVVRRIKHLISLIFVVHFLFIVFQSRRFNRLTWNCWLSSFFVLISPRLMCLEKLNGKKRFLIFPKLGLDFAKSRAPSFIFIVCDNGPCEFILYWSKSL